jgi:hypothetical protein
MEMGYGWDLALGETVAVTLNGVPQDAYLTLYWGKSGWFGDTSLVGDFCSVTYNMNGLSEPSWVAQGGWWWGVETLDASTAVTDCGAFNICSGTFVNDDPITEMASYTWEFAGGGTIDPYVVSTANPTPIDQHWGGEVYSDFWGVSMPSFHKGWELDALGNVLLGNPHTTSTAPVGGAIGQPGLADGYYVHTIPWIFSI